jgi:hypothetical protein
VKSRCARGRARSGSFLVWLESLELPSKLSEGSAEREQLADLIWNDSDGINRYEEAMRELHIGGRRSRWRRVGHVSGIDLVETRKVIDIRVEDRDLDQMIHRCPSGFQDGCEILERLFSLCLDTVGRQSGSGIDARGT